jgi:Cys-tRNA(Pro)/Cys-tRNA(Cys) deacylase
MDVETATPAIAALRAAGIEFRAHDYRARLGDHATATDVAVLLGVRAERVLKTLVVEVSGKDRRSIGAGPRDKMLVIAVIPVDARLDLRALAAAAGGDAASLAERSLAERATGYALGAISPFGQARLLPTFVDASALAHSTVFVSAGRPGLEIEIAPADLIRATNGHSVPMALPRSPRGGLAEPGGLR